MTDEQQTLTRVHQLRMAAHWGKGFDALAPGRWPQTDADWRQTPHGAPWDSNVEMARFNLDLARKIEAEGLLAKVDGPRMAETEGLGAKPDQRGARSAFAQTPEPKS